MKEFKGTPKTGSNWCINVNNPMQTLIENICIIDEPWINPIVQADAYLISAAPELLKALQNTLALINSTFKNEGWNCEEYSEVIKGREAVNKALGL